MFSKYMPPLEDILNLFTPCFIDIAGKKKLGPRPAFFEGGN